MLAAQINLFAQPGAIKYNVDSASIENAGVPKREIIKFTYNQLNPLYQDCKLNICKSTCDNITKIKISVIRTASNLRSYQL